MTNARKKKVLFTSHVANFQKFNRPFMRMLSEQGYEVHYASMGEEEILDADKAFTIPFTRSPFKLSNIKAYRQLKKIIDREKYDLIHTHTPMGSVVTRLAAREARKKGTRVIYTAHGFHFFKGAPLLNWIIYYPVEKWVAKHTDTLITINNEDYERAKKKFKTDVQYVPGVGVDPKRFEPRLTEKQRNELRASLGLKADDFVMIYPAELSKRKNQTALLKSIRKSVALYPHTHLLLAGKDSMNGLHSSAAKSYGIEKNVHFIGYRADIPQLLMASDLSVSTSTQEGLPVHIMEAMAAGLPVVTMACRGATELIEHGKNGLICKLHDIDGMSNNIMKLVNNQRYMDQLKSKSRSQVTQSDILIDKIEAQMSTIYEGL